MPSMLGACKSDSSKCTKIQETDTKSSSFYQSILTQSYTPLPTGRIYKLLDQLQCKYVHVKDKAHSPNREHSIFAIEYNSHGNLLIAVSDIGSILLYDCLQQKEIQAHPRSHSAPVNIIKFVSEHKFLTGSDDCTCKLWDVRSMKSCVSTLISHECWVKNIELEARTGLILSSAFDDTIRVWSSIEGTPSSSILLTAQDLVRMKLSPTGSKLAFSLRSSPAMLCIINSFNSSTLGSDQQMTDYLTIDKNFELFVKNSPETNPEELPLSNSMQNYIELNSKKENSLQFILDYPILDSQISRDHKVITYDISLKNKNLCGSCSRYPYLYELATFYSLAFHPSGEYLIARQGSPDWPVRYTCIYHLSDNSLEDFAIGEVSDTNTFYNLINKHRLVQIIPESTHRPDGIIREVCFNPGGNLILSPHEHGIRLYPFSSCRTELNFDSSQIFNPHILEDYITCTGHSEAVVTCKMSPTSLQIASGCLGGEVSFYSPKLV